MKLSHEDRASIDFVLTLRRRWADAMYPALRAQYEARTKGRAPRGRKEAAPVVHELPSYRWFAWMERGSQKMLWRAVSDAVARNGKARAVPAGPARLELDPTLELPDWYSDWDIHVQPGGVWKSDASADVYELGAKLGMLGLEARVVERAQASGRNVYRVRLGPFDKATEAEAARDRIAASGIEAVVLRAEKAAP